MSSKSLRLSTRWGRQICTFNSARVNRQVNKMARSTHRLAHRSSFSVDEHVPIKYVNCQD